MGGSTAGQRGILACWWQAGGSPNAAEQMTEHMPGAAMVVAHVVGQSCIVLVAITHSVMRRRLVVHHAGRVGMSYGSRNRLPAEFRREHGKQHDHHQEAKHD